MVIDMTMRQRYEHIMMLKELRRDHEDQPDMVAFADGLIKDAKIEIRRLLRISNRRKEETYMVRDDGIDGAVLRIKMVGASSRETAEQTFLDEYYIPPIRCAWDCTGQSFTAWYKIVQLHGEWYAYHGISVDC